MNNSKPEFLSCEQVRCVDRYAIEKIGIDGVVLMENAARGCVDLLLSQSVPGAVVVVCGPGNNGGDGFAMVRHLMIRNVEAKAVLICEPDRLKGDALRNYEILNHIAPLAIEKIDSAPDQILGQLIEVNGQSAEWIVDALLGTGTKGEIRDPVRSVIDLINIANKKVFDVDIPSGLDGDTGQTLGASIKADVTATFVAKKNGFAIDEAKSSLGDLHVLDIGVPEFVVAEAITHGSNN